MSNFLHSYRSNQALTPSMLSTCYNKLDGVGAEGIFNPQLNGALCGHKPQNIHHVTAISQFSGTIILDCWNLNKKHLNKSNNQTQKKAHETHSSSIC